MKLKKSYLFIALLILPIFLFGQKKKETYNPKKTFTPTQLKEDFTFLRKCLDEAHPGLNWYISKDSLNQIFDNFEKNLTTDLTERQFRNRLFPVIAEIRCGHSSLANSKERMKYLEKNTTKYLPFDIISVVNTNIKEPVYQLFIKENKSKDSTIRKGNEIVSIDGVPSKEIIKTMANSFISDGYNQNHKYHVFKNHFQIWYPRLFEEKDTFLVEIRDSIRQQTALKIPAIVAKTFPFEVNKKTEHHYIFTKKKKALTFHLDEKNNKIGVLQVKSFIMSGYRTMYRKTFKYIKKNKIDDLVLDMRGNGGGMIFHPGALLSYLIPNQEKVTIYRPLQKPSFMDKTEGKGKGLNITYKLFPKIPKSWGVTSSKTNNEYRINIINKVRSKNHYKGNLYVLTDGGCFSATSYTAAFLKKHKRAFIIGDETGGGEKGCNAMVMNYLTLPNTHLRYRFPFFRVEHDVEPSTFGRGVFPDFYTEYDKKSRLEGRDLEMEKVREMVKKTNW